MFELIAAIALTLGMFVAMLTLPIWMEKLVDYVDGLPFLVNRR